MSLFFNKVTVFFKLFFKYLVTLFSCNVLRTNKNFKCCPSQTFNEGKKRINLNKHGMHLVGEGLIDEKYFDSHSIFKSIKPGFFFMAHKMKKNKDIKNYWDFFRGFNIPFQKQFIRRLSIKDRLLLGIEWSSPMEKSIELINIFIRSALKSDKCLYTNKNYIHFSATYIENNLEINKEVSNNHFLTNLAALCLYENVTSNKNYWKTKFIDECRKQFMDDGSNFEGSTSYHFFATELLATTYFLVDGIHELDEILKKSLGICKLLMRSDGSIPYIGDNDSGRITKIFVENSESEELLGNYRIFIDFCLANIAAVSPTSLSSFGDKKVLNKKSKLKEKLSYKIDCKAGDLSVYYFKGLSLFLIRNNSLAITFKAGEIGQQGKGGHDHYDQLSITLSYKNNLIFDDLGVCRYYGGSNFERGKSSEFHNSFIDQRQKNNESKLGFIFKKNSEIKFGYSNNTVYAELKFNDFSIGRRLDFNGDSLLVYDLYQDKEHYQNPLSNFDVRRFETYGKPN